MTRHKTNTASLELCKELYELSGWRDTEKYWYRNWLMQTADYRVSWQVGHLGQADETTFPAYDLGYLLRKLPNYWVTGKNDNEHGLFMEVDPVSGFWRIGFGGSCADAPFPQEADTPEGAACQLAIELFQRGVLTRSQGR